MLLGNIFTSLDKKPPQKPKNNGVCLSLSIQAVIICLGPSSSGEVKGQEAADLGLVSGERAS